MSKQQMSQRSTPNTSSLRLGEDEDQSGTLLTPKMSKSPNRSPKPSSSNISDTIPEESIDNKESKTSEKSGEPEDTTQNEDPNLSTYSPRTVQVLTVVAVWLTIVMCGSLLGIWLVLSELHNLRRVQEERQEKIRTAWDCETRGGDIDCNNALLGRLINFTETSRKKLIEIKRKNEEKHKQAKQIEDLSKRHRAAERRQRRDTGSNEEVAPVIVQNTNKTAVYFTAVATSDNGVVAPFWSVSGSQRTMHNYNRYRVAIPPDSIFRFSKLISASANYGGFNTETSIFTSPVSGVYMLKVSVARQYGTGTTEEDPCSLILKKNKGKKITSYGSRIFSLHLDRAGDVASNSAIVWLEKGDEVGLYTADRVPTWSALLMRNRGSCAAMIRGVLHWKWPNDPSQTPIPLADGFLNSFTGILLYEKA